MGWRRLLDKPFETGIPAVEGDALVVDGGFWRGVDVTALQTAQSLGIYASSQTTGQSSSSTVDARSLTFVGMGGMSVGASGGSIILSGAAGGAGGSQSFGMSNLGNTSGTSGIASGSAVRFLLAGGNNITLSQSLDGASGTITISAPNQSAQSLGVYGLNQTTGESSSSTVDARTISIHGAGAVSVGLSGGSVVISAPNTIAQSVQTIGLYASSQTTGESSSSTVDARSITLVGDGAVSVGLSGGSFRISVPNVVAQSAQSLGLYAVGNTTGESSSTTRDARSISVDGAGLVSVGYSAGTLRISATAAAQTVQTLGVYALGNTTGESSSSTRDARSLSFEGAGAVSVGMSAGSVRISVPAVVAQTVESQSIGASNLGNTLGTSGVASGGQVRAVIVGTNWLTISQSVDGASATLSINPGGYMSRWEHNTAALYSSSSSAMVNTSVSFVRMQIPHYVSFSRVDVPMSISLQTQSSTNTAGNRQSWVYAIYTRNASTITPLVGGSVSSTLTWASSTGKYSSLTGVRLLSFGLATALTPGEYYFGLQASTSTYSATEAANTTNRGATIAPIHATSFTATPWRDMSALTAASINDLYHMQGVGSISLSATAQTYQASNITMSGVSAQQANMIVILRNV